MTTFVEFCQTGLPMPETFGYRLREARKKVGLTQSKAAGRAGRSKIYWCHVEVGQNRPEEKYLKLMEECRVLWNAYAKHAPDRKWHRVRNRLIEARARLEPFARAVNSTVEELLGQVPAEENSQSSAGQVDLGMVE